MSILEAARMSLIRRGTAFELLEAQAASGKIIDVQCGKAVTLETALATRVIDKSVPESKHVATIHSIFRNFVKTVMMNREAKV